MGYGFQVLNYAGQTLIDDTWKCMSVQAEGSATTSGNPATPVAINLPRSFSTSEVPTIWIQVFGTVAGIGWTWGSGSSFSQLYAYTMTGYGAGTINWKITTSAASYPANPGTHGLHVFNASGELVFDSRQRMALIRGTFTIPVNSSGLFSHEDCTTTNSPFYSVNSTQWGDYSYLGANNQIVYRVGQKNIYLRSNGSSTCYGYANSPANGGGYPTPIMVAEFS